MRTISNIFSTIISLLLLISSQEIKSQTHPLLNSDHIPFMAYGWRSNEFQTFDYTKIKDMGLDGVMFVQVNQTMFDKFAGIYEQVKLLPYQTSYDTNYPSFIAKYTAGAYTKWEAADVTNSPIKAALQFNTDIGERSGETPNCIKTKTSQPGRLISGPGYRQRLRYPLDDGVIEYRARFNMMLKPGPVPPSQGQTVCTLKVMFKELTKLADGSYIITDSTSIDSIIQVYKMNFNEWVPIDIQYIPNTIGSEYQYSIIETETEESESPKQPDFVRYVEFIVDWAGLSNATLYFDNVTVSDVRGRELTDPNSSTYRDQVTNMANNIYNAGTVWNENVANFTSTVAGWYANDEPETIDNLEPVRIVGELIRNATSSQRPLFVSFAMPWNGLWDENGFGTGAINKAQEFYHRALPDGFIMQSHIYKNSSLDDQKNQIIRYIINLESLQSTAPIYSVLVQAGKWVSAYVEIDPTPEQFRYSINLALLYGAKGIFTDQLFYISDQITGIIDAHYQPAIYSPLYNEIKITLSPRLKGTFGKTLRILSQQSQYPNINVVSGLFLNYSFIDKIEVTSGSGDCFADLGFFKDNSDLDKKYFMAVNRYYSILQNLKFTFQGLSGYKNWEVTDLVDNVKVTVQTDVSNKAIFEDVIIPGDGRLYSVLPVVKYGGKLKYNESIGDNTIKGEIFIDTGVSLTLNNNSTINFTGSGFITGSGYLNVNSNFTLNTTAWDKSLFRSQSNNHPKLVWGVPSGTQVNYYKIYRKLGSLNWTLLTTTTNKSYIDNTVNIPQPGEQAGADVQYRLTYVYTSESAYSNTIIFTTTTQDPGKINSGSEPEYEEISYNLLQNFPNPFNPSSQISYSIKEDGFVTLKIYDVLGNEITTLVNEPKAAGNYTADFNASNLSSGVYIYTIKANEFTASKKMILTK